MTVTEHIDLFERMAFFNAWFALTGWMPARAGFGVWTVRS